MNYPVWAFPAPGLLIAAVGIVHVFVSHFAVGGGLFLVLAERRARAGRDAALLSFVRALSRGFALLTLVLGALTGVGVWFTIGLVQPQATSALVTVFVWAWAIEWTFFALEIAAALVYYHGWDRLDARTHLAVGWIYFAAALASLVVITGILSFMLTSGRWPQTRQFADGFFNPSFLPTVALRAAGAVGLTGLYVLFAAAFLKDREAKARIARWTATRWIAPAAVAVPTALVWFLSVADRTGVAVAETLGATDGSPLSLLAALVQTTSGGQPIVRGAARATLLATALLVVASLLIAALRPRRYGRAEASCLLLLGLVSIGGSEWTREGLRKPWVIDRYMFVNGVRLPALASTQLLASSGDATSEPDPFALDVLGERGLLATSPWHPLPDASRPGDPALERLPEAQRLALEDRAGRVVFAVECAICHTERGHLGIRRLVAAKSASAIRAVLDATARPLTADGRVTSWSDPRVRVSGWLGRRMPPFAGTEAEKQALAIHLSRLGGEAAPPPPPPGAGLAVFESHCAVCHGPEAAWPIAPRLRGRTAAQLYDAIGRLPELRPQMPPFSGSDAERRALADYLGALAAASLASGSGTASTPAPSVVAR